ncbi:MAG: hypothetical protein WBW88_11280 [Rhodothermales bacterium]
MNETSGAVIWWILGPLFIAVLIYLAWFQLKRKKMLEAFARAHQMDVRPDLRDSIQKTLDDCFKLGEGGFIRTFGQLSSIVDGGSIRLLRAIELLDLNPRGQSSSTHFARIAALFEIGTRHDSFFVLSKSKEVRPRLGGSTAVDSAVAQAARRIAAACNARHALSVTLAQGHGLIYFEPVVTGGENRSDVESLYCIAEKMQEEFGDG